MSMKKESRLDFIVDKLTHSIENVVTGESFATAILVVSKELDVDFIGNQEPLTKEQEDILKEYFKKQKQLKKRKLFRVRKTSAKRLTIEK